MKEELIKTDDGTYNRERRTLLELLDYADSMLRVAEDSIDSWQGQLADDYVGNFSDCAGPLYRARLERDFYDALRAVITDEDSGAAEVAAWLRSMEAAALEVIKSRPLHVANETELESLVRRWLFDFNRFEYRETGRLLGRHFYDPDDSGTQTIQ